MKLVLKKSFIWFCFLFLLAGLLAGPAQSAHAQTEPEVTPQEGYPPPATPLPTEEGYPSQPVIPSATPFDAAYVSPTIAAPVIAGPETVIGSEAVEPTAVPVATLPISQSTLVRNRAILWAGFLITLLIFSMAVYGAMLMYTRRRN